MTKAIAMTDNPFFVGKNEILRWVNSTLKLDVQKIEQACTGAIYCQIIDAIYPGKVKMEKVNWKAKLEHEFLQNFKVLQQAFTDCKIMKNIEIAKLSKGKYQDNLEMLQWLKWYFDNQNPCLVTYDAEKRRNGNELEYGNENINNGNKRRPNSKQQSESKEFAGNLKIPIKTNNKTTNAIPSTTPVRISEEEQVIISSQKVNEEKKPEEVNEVDIAVSKRFQERLDLANDEIVKCKTEINTLKMSISEIGKERDFYFSKLRDIEILTSKYLNIERDGLISLIKSILFAEKEVELMTDKNGKPCIK